MTDLGKTSKGKWVSALAIAVVAGLFVIVNMLGNALLSTTRIDLTENRMYTLSEGTKRVLASLTEPVTLRYFYSEKQANGYPVIQSYGSRLKGLLTQYRTLSDGKVRVEFVDPELFSEEEDLAVALGIADLTVDSAGNKLYFGLAASNATADRRIIPFFDPDKAPFIEYELTHMIRDLSRQKKPKIGLMTWLPLPGGGSAMFDAQRPWVIFRQMEESYEVAVLDTAAKSIPEDVDVLMVVHPDEKISEESLYAIDQFILRGGRAIIFTDPYTRVDIANPPAPALFSPPMPPSSSNMAKLYHRWGVDMPAADIVADPAAAIRVRSDGQQDSILSSVGNPIWLAVQKNNFNAEEIISADLEMMRFIVSGRFVSKPEPAGEEKESSALAMTPLVVSGAAAALPKSALEARNPDPAQFMQEASPIGGMAVLAARLHGTAHTAFPGHAGKDHLEVSKRPVNIVVVADVDMLRDAFWVNRQEFQGQEILTPTANNGGFVLNALDYLAGGSDLSGLRSRMISDRPFERVEEMRLKAEATFRRQEDRLKAKLANLERRLGELHGAEQPVGNESGDGALSGKQQEALDRFRDEMLSTRKELRAVQRSLREETEALGTRLKLVNIGLMPLLVLALAWIVPTRLGMRRR